MLTDLRPLCGQEEFEALVTEMVADSTPRLFALVQELGERADGRIAAWGMTFESGHTDVFAHGKYLSLRSPENALRYFTREPHIRARLVWVGSGQMGPQCGEECVSLRDATDSE